MADSFAQLIAESLTAIAAQAPASYSSTSALAHGLILSITIDGEEISVVADPLLRVDTATQPAHVYAQTSTRAIAAILDGDTTIERLILDDQLRLHGSLDNLARCHEVLIGFVHGAIRAPAVPKLRHRFDACARVSS